MSASTWLQVAMDLAGLTAAALAGRTTQRDPWTYRDIAAWACGWEPIPEEATPWLSYVVSKDWPQRGGDFLPAFFLREKPPSQITGAFFCKIDPMGSQVVLVGKSCRWCHEEGEYLCDAPMAGHAIARCAMATPHWLVLTCIVVQNTANRRAIHERPRNATTFGALIND